MYLMASWPALISVAPIGLPRRRWIGITIGDLFTVRQIQRAFGIEAMAVVQSLAVDNDREGSACRLVIIMEAAIKRASPHWRSPPQLACFYLRRFVWLRPAQCRAFGLKT